jgi:DNA-binding SARP family transcriptional activator
VTAEAATEAPTARRAHGDVELSLLNAFRLRCSERDVELPLSAQRLVAFLALHEGRLQRVYVAGNLWLDASEARAAASLRSVLWRIQRLGLGVVEANGSSIALAPEVRVDAREAGTLAERLIAGEGELDRLRPADVALTGELLPDWYDDWVLLERERLRQLTLHALEALAERFLAASRFGEALQAALAAVAGEPLRESAHRIVIRVHLREGNAGEALRQYRLCGGLLQEQLGLAPSAQLTDLVRGLA